MLATTPNDFFGDMETNEWINLLSLSLIRRFSALKRTLESNQRFEAFRGSISEWESSRLGGDGHDLADAGTALFEICREFDVLEVVCPEPNRKSSVSGPVRGVIDSGEESGSESISRVLHEVAKLFAV